MFVVMNLYQNGDIEIVKKSSEWDSEEEVIFNENFFKHEDSYRVFKIYERYQDVVSKFETLKGIGKNSWDKYLKNEEKRGEKVETVVLLDMSFREFQSSAFSNNGLARKDLESNLNKITEKLLKEAKAFKKERQKQVKEDSRKLSEELSSVVFE